MGRAQTPTDRWLPGAADLYGVVYYFHPTVCADSTLRFRWDRASATAVEALVGDSAHSRRSLVQRWLATWGDPGIRMSADTSARGTRWAVTEGAGGAVVVTADPNGGADRDAVVEALRDRTKLVFDLRAPGGVGGFRAANFVRALHVGELSGARFRVRTYRGYPSDRPIHTGSYRPYAAAWRDTVMPTISGGSRVGHVPRVAFVLAAGSVAPPSALALRHAGLATIVATGPVAPAGPLYRVRIEDRVEVDVSLGQLLSSDGQAVEVADTLAPSAPVAAALSRLSTPHRTPLGAEDVRPAAESVPATDGFEPLPPLGGRVLAAFRIWNMAHRFFPYAGLVEEDWDAELREAVGELREARDPTEYALALAHMSTGLHDSHALVTGPSIDQGYFGEATPGIGLRILPEGPVVTGFSTEALREATGLRVGDLLLVVDGEPVRERLERMARVTPHSTPQALRNQLASRFLSGSVGSELSLTFLRGERDTLTTSLPRESVRGWFSAFGMRGATITEVAPGVGYVDLTRLSMDDLPRLLDRIGVWHAVVFDLRGYPDFTAYVLGARIAADPSSVVSISRTPLLDSPDTTRMDLLVEPSTIQDIADLVAPDLAREGPRYRGAVAVLVDERTQSRGEWSAQILAGAGALVVGSPTSGVNGDITFAQLPGALQLRFSGLAVTLANGAPLQRHGVPLDIEVHVDREAIRTGQDPLLDRAIRELVRQVPGSGGAGGT